MDMPKNNIYNVSYTSVLGQDSVKTKKNINFFKKFKKTNKLIITIFMIFLMCFVLNIVLIYHFINILKNMSF